VDREPPVAAPPEGVGAALRTCSALSGGCPQTAANGLHSRPVASPDPDLCSNCDYSSASNCSLFQGGCIDPAPTPRARDEFLLPPGTDGLGDADPTRLGEAGDLFTAQFYLQVLRARFDFMSEPVRQVQHDLRQPHLHRLTQRVQASLKFPKEGSQEAREQHCHPGFEPHNLQELCPGDRTDDGLFGEIDRVRERRGG
jgi:hypothetical protein